MPIDISIETPISLTEATAHVPRRRRGRKTAVSTMYRWATVGVRGIRLETLQVGGTRCTSLPALQRFFNCLSANNEETLAVPTRSSQQRVERAERELDEIWGKKPTEA